MVKIYIRMETNVYGPDILKLLILSFVKMIDRISPRKVPNFLQHIRQNKSYHVNGKFSVNLKIHHNIRVYELSLITNNC